MKTISKTAMRQKTVSNVLASLRMEHLQPSPAVVQAMVACVAGQVSTAHVRQQVMQQHVTLQRH